MPLVRVLAAGMLVAVVVLASAAPASAHDQLVFSSPAAGERMPVAPREVSLTFTDTPLTLGADGMVVLVIDADGRDWVDGSPWVEDRTVIAKISAGMPEAGYELRWQIVSADGHPISGVVPFTIGNAEPLVSPRDPTEPAPAGSDPTQEQSAAELQRIIRMALLGAGGAATAVAIFALVSFLRRRTRGGTDAAL